MPSSLHPPAQAPARRTLSSTAQRKRRRRDDGGGTVSKEDQDLLPQFEELIQKMDRPPKARDALLANATEEELKKLNLSAARIDAIEEGVRQARSDFHKSMDFSLRLAVAQQKRGRDFFNEGEDDPDLLMEEEMTDDQFEEDDMLPLAHAKLEEHRDVREYARLAVWDMPLLSKFAKPFEPPSSEQPLRWRYTSYMGEFHPAEKKVVVEFSPGDLPLTDMQKSKLRKLVGTRYNPETDIVKMACENFEHPAQNKRYLGDLIAKLVIEAKDPTDTFEDIPLDTRHHEFKTKPKFPREWRISKARREELAQLRQQSYELDIARREKGLLVDGKERILDVLPPLPGKGPQAIEAKASELLKLAVSRGGKQSRPMLGR